LFSAIGAVSARWMSGAPRTAPLAWRAAARAAWLPATVEALVLTLLAALWFGSLGHGGWLLVFLLLGTLAGGGDRWLRHRLAGTPLREDLVPFAAGLLKYCLAGGLCAWYLT
jgi:hypothetical protein